MQTETVDVRVKSKGKTFEGSCEVEIFESLDEAIDFYESEYEEAEDPNAEAASHVLKLVNRSHKADVTNRERSRLRPKSADAQLRDLVKTDEKVAAMYQELLRKAGLAE